MFSDFISVKLTLDNYIGLTLHSYFLNNIRFFQNWWLLYQHVNDVIYMLTSLETRADITLIGSCVSYTMAIIPYLHSHLKTEIGNPV